MADTVETAIYRLRVEGQAEIDRLTKSVDGLAVAEEKATASTRTMSQGLQNMVSKYDPLIRAQEQYRKDLEKIARAREAGTGTETQLNAAFAGATQRYQAHASAIQSVEKATVAHTNATKLQRHELINLSRQFQDIGVSLFSGQSPLTVLMQQGTQVADVFATSQGTVRGFFGQLASGAAALITPMNALIAGVVAATAAAAALALQWDKVQVSSQRAISGAGARTGTSIEDINRFVGQNAGIGTSKLSETEARKLAEAWTATGEIVIGQTRDMGQAVVGFANQTSKSIDESIKFFERMGKEPKKAIEELGEAFGGFDIPTRKAIDAMLLADDKTGALQVAVDALSESLKSAAGNMTLLEKAQRGLITGAGKEMVRPSGLEAEMEAARARLNAGIASAGGLRMPFEKAPDIAKLSREFEDATRAVEKFKAAGAAAELTKISNEADKATRSLTPQTEQIRKLEEAIAALERAREKGQTSKYGAGADEAALTAAQNQLQALKESQAEAARYNERVKEIAASWGDVSQSVAQQLQTMQNNLPVAEAVGGAARMAAQATADFANAMDRGKTATEAAALAAANLATAMAQVNAQSREAQWQAENKKQIVEAETALINEQIALGRTMTGDQAASLGMKQRELEDQAKINQLLHDGVSAEQAAKQVAAERAVAHAKVAQEVAKTLQRLGQEKEMAGAVNKIDEMRIQFQRTYNQLRKQGVDHATAEKVAMAEFLVEQEKANTAIKRQIQDLDQASEMILAEANGMGAVVRAAQAYDNAIRSGADATHAAAMSAAVLYNELAKAAAEAHRLEQAGLDAANGLRNGILTPESAMALGPGGSAFAPSVMPSGPLTFAGSIDRQVNNIVSQLQAKASVEAQGIAGLAETAYKSGGLAGALAAIKTAPDTFGAPAGMVLSGGGRVGTPIDVQTILGEERSSIAEKISTYDQLTQLMNAQTADKGAQAANLESELAWLQTLPVSIARDQKITDLLQSIDQLTASTDDLNQTNKDLLSPYYTQDPRTSHIGFRSQGMAAGGYVDVPGGYSANDNMMAMVPVASGERIYVDPNTRMRGPAGGQAITINAPVAIYGNANKDDVGRSVYQNAQAAARQIAMASA